MEETTWLESFTKMEERRLSHESWRIMGYLWRKDLPLKTREVLTARNNELVRQSLRIDERMAQIGIAPCGYR